MAKFNLPFGLNIASSDPIDTRQVVPSQSSRFSLITLGLAYEGMLVYQGDTKKTYVLKGNTNDDWEEVGLGAAGSGGRDIIEDPIILDGTLYELNVNNTVYTLQFNNGVTSQEFTIIGLQSISEFTSKFIIDNSQNNSAVTITWPNTISWDDSVPVTGPTSIAANSKYILEIETEFSNKAFAYLIPRNE